MMGLEFIMIFQASSNQAGHYSSYGAYYYVHTGEAYNFHQEYPEAGGYAIGRGRRCTAASLISSARGFCA